jgi:hypothetical protein
MTKPSTFKTLAQLSAVLFVVCFCIVIYALYFEPASIYYQNRPFPVIVKQVVAGSPVPLEVERCSSESKTFSYVITHTLHSKDDVIPPVLLPDVRVAIDPGCFRSISRINIPPDTTTPGVYYISGIANIKGMLIIHQLAWTSEEFTVVAKPKVVVEPKVAKELKVANEPATIKR